MINEDYINLEKYEESIASLSDLEVKEAFKVFVIDRLKKLSPQVIKEFLTGVTNLRLNLKETEYEVFYELGLTHIVKRDVH